MTHIKTKNPSCELETIGLKQKYRITKEQTIVADIIFYDIIF